MQRYPSLSSFVINVAKTINNKWKKEIKIKMGGRKNIYSKQKCK